MNQPEIYSKGNDFLKKFLESSWKKYGKYLEFNNENSVEILDVGVGDGNISEYFLKNHLPNDVKYVGTDISNAMLQYAKKHEIFNGKKLQTLDITTENFPQELKNKFDVVVSFFVFHWIDKVELALKNIYQALKPNGQVYIIFFDGKPVDKIFEDISKNPKWSKYNTEKWCLETYKTNTNILEYYEKIVQKTNFTEKKIFRDIASGQQEIKSLEKCFIGVNPTVNCIPVNERDDYIEDYLKLLREQDYFRISEDGVTVNVVHPIITIYLKK